VIYSFEFEISSNSTFDVEINQPPKPGSCSIDPLNGTIITLFTINCFNWMDQDQIKDYSIYGLYFYLFFSLINNFMFEKGWTKDYSKPMILSHTTKSSIKLRLPASIDQTSTLQIVVQIRDTFDSGTEVNLSSIIVLANSSAIKNLIDILQNSDNDLSNDPLIQLLSSDDQNTVGQIITSISQVFNEINDDTIKNAALSKCLFR
jgi:hypothetical protein